MGYYTTIAELQRAGIGIRAGEAVAIAQKLINGRPAAPPQPPFGPPSPENVIVDELGTVTCSGCDVKPAVSEIAILLDAMLPAGTRLPGALHYTIARGLLNVDAPPFGSIEELSFALSRFERHERDDVIRDLVTRAQAVASGSAPAAVIPFKHAVSSVRIRAERRRPLPLMVTELRRELRRADLERYARRAASTLPDLRGALGQHKRPIGAVVAGLAAGVLLIASGELMQVGGAVAESSPPLPVVNPPAPSIHPPMELYLRPSDSSDQLRPGRAPTISSPITVSRRASRAVAERPARSATGARSHKPRVVQSQRTDRNSRRTSGNGVLARLRLQWVRTLFTYRRDL